MKFSECPTCNDFERKHPEFELATICLTCDGFGKVLSYEKPQRSKDEAIELAVKAFANAHESKTN